MGRKRTFRVVLTLAERQSLQEMVRSGRAPARQVARARVLLKADEAGPGWGDAKIAESLDLGIATIARTRRDFVRRGVEAVLRSSQPSRPEQRVLDGAAEARLVQLACSKPPDAHDHWTMELLADRTVKLHYVPAISAATICRTLKKTRSNPG
jgi:transposase